ncbi:hypothetical protein ACLKA6_004981 [Drosophila palustris]
MGHEFLLEFAGGQFKLRLNPIQAPNTMHRALLYSLAIIACLVALAPTGNCLEFSVQNVASFVCPVDQFADVI